MHAFFCFALLWVCVVGADVDEMARVKAGNYQFSAKILSEVVKLKSKNKESFVISALSVVPPLSVLALGSEGRTHAELLNTLGFEDDDCLKRQIKEVSSQLTKATGVQVNLANRIYLPMNAELNNDFAKNSKNELLTEVEKIDFAKGPESVAAINEWVKEKTNNKIVDLIEPNDVNSNTELILVNALYFVGSWPNEFSSTKSGIFHKTETSQVEVPFMHRQDHYGYSESTDLDAKILELSYAKSDASFVIILPNSVNGLDSLLEKIKDSSKLSEVVKGLPNKTVRVSIPKFKIETETDLIPILKNIGVNGLFTSNELTKILQNSKSLSVSQAKQKAFISVDEKGTEAAAANKVILLGSSGIIQKVEIFNADHPFFFMIQKSDLILFSGVFYA